MRVRIGGLGVGNSMGGIKYFVKGKKGGCGNEG